MNAYRTDRRLRRLGALITAGVIATSLAACSGNDGGSGDEGGTEVKLGYFPNLTHASAIVGIEKGYFKDQLADDDATVKVFDFNSGSDVITQLQGGGLDASYIGPSPAITAYASDPSVSLISGATSGGASLMVADSIAGIEDLAGKTLATPGPANTQDVALKFWLGEQGFEVDAEGKGEVTVINQDNSVTIQAFQTGEIDGAWVPEPYASIMESDGATRLVDEASLWPDGQFVTTHLLVRNDFMEENPELVEDLLQAQIEANDYINANSDEAKTVVGGYISGKTGSQVPAEALDKAWDSLTFTNDPIADSLLQSADHAVSNGQLEPVDDLAGIYSLDALNALLSDAGQPEVSGPSQ